MRRLFVFAGVIVGMLTIGREASAFCRTTTCDLSTEECRKNKDGCIRDGVPVVWAKLPITYRFHRSGSERIDGSLKDLKKSVKEAFAKWSEVECRDGRTSVRFVEGADIAADKPLNKKEASQPFGIYFRDEEWPHRDGDESLALTNQIYGERTGTIDYADIEVNTANNEFTLDGADGIDFQSVMIHEAGHYIGLAHSNAEDSIMVARYCENADRCNGDVETLRELSDDDRDAVCAVYPPSRDDGSAPAETAGCETTTRSPKELAGVFGLAFLAFAVVRRRRSAYS